MDTIGGTDGTTEACDGAGGVGAGAGVGTPLARRRAADRLVSGLHAGPLRHWVSNLTWDWCISRQRFFGVPFPAWHCDVCGAVVLAEDAQLPLDPANATPPRPCDCGNAALFARLFPMQLRPQAHDIVRTWAFYSILNRSTKRS